MRDKHVVTIDQRNLAKKLPDLCHSLCVRRRRRGILIGMSGFLVNADQTGVAPPQGSAPLLEVVADGVQIYTCETKGSLFQWSFKAPEANLFDKQGRQIGTHFAGPTWRIADGSAIVGEVVAKADAPERGAIEWLLLRAKAHEGQGVLGEAAFIRRTDTKGRNRADSRL